MNWKNLYRIDKEEELTVRKRGGRRRIIWTKAPIASRILAIHSRACAVDQTRHCDPDGSCQKTNSNGNGKYWINATKTDPKAKPPATPIPSSS
ncbi:MAG: hypothetical protein JKY92_10225 [Magnetovibrio sp.]|nr:hypothetical protein [Magnetovibrio sp.]